jgi:DNA-binding winged helix-turn-helix (wHTH) protein/tetratricopeptide (TPR) repeat protein
MLPSGTPSRLRFEDFELDLEAGVLLRGGEIVKLPPQPFQVLRTLVESSGRVVTRDELKRAVWAEGTHVDFEGSLHSCVKQIRAALEDDALSPRFVETLPRRGYRFLRAVDSPSPATMAPPRRRSYVALFIGLASAALLASIAASDRTGVPDRDSEPTSTPAMPLTLLVSPFSNETGDGSLDYLGKALAEETLGRLSTLDPSKLVVLAPRTAELYRGGGKEPPIDYELTGSVIGSGTTPSLSVDLVRRSDGARLWSDRIEDGDTVSRMVAGLVPRLVASRSTSASPDSADPGGALPPALEAYWKGRYLSRAKDAAGLERAERCFRQAIALRADWAPPFVGLGEIQLHRAMASGEESSYAEAAETATRAIGIEPSGDAQFILALARWYGAWNWEEAGRAFQRAILKAPGLARAHHWYAYYLTGLGRHPEAIFEIERARTLDPLSPEVQSDVGWFYYFGGRYPEAVEASRRTLELEPSFLLAQDCIIESYLAMGREAEALDEAKTFLGIAGSKRVDTLGGLESFWRIRLEQAASTPGRLDSYEAAIASLRLGREEEAIRWLRRAVDERSLWLPMLAVDPRLSKLRGRTELQAVRAAIGLGRARQEVGSP